MAVSAVVTILGLGEIVGADDPEPQALPKVWRGDLRLKDEREALRAPHTVSPSPGPEVPQKVSQEATQPDTEPVPALTGPEGVICAHFPEDCEHALRVFACESGPDYIDGNLYDRYAGAAQVDTELHGWRFSADPYDLHESMRVARQLYNERGWAPWPVCRYA